MFIATTYAAADERTSRTMSDEQPKKERKPRDTRPKFTPIEKVKDQLAKNPNLTMEQLGQLNGVTHGSIVRLLQRHGIQRNSTEVFRNRRAEILATLQGEILSSITEENLTKASLRDKVIAAGVLYDKERLETGNATSITAIYATASTKAEKDDRVVDAEFEPVDE